MQVITLSAEALAPIRARFLIALRDREPRIAQAVALSGIADPAQLLEDVHKIRGVAPMLGLAQMGSLAADAEDRLDHWLSLPQPPANAPPPRLPEDLHCCLRALHMAVREALAESPSPPP